MTSSRTATVQYILENYHRVHFRELPQYILVSSTVQFYVAVHYGEMLQYMDFCFLKEYSGL